MINKALESWYVEGHPLRLDPLHPLLGMAGEAGELLNLYKKNEYKPDFNWDNCVCGHPKDSHEMFGGGDDCCLECSSNHHHAFTPKILDELGDFWYYLRIVAWQQNLRLKPGEVWDLNIVNLLSSLLYYSSNLLDDWLDWKTIKSNYVFTCYDILLGLLYELEYPIDQLTELNYKKLSGPDQNGWASARGIDD